MSRIGNAPIKLPNGVEVKEAEQSLKVKGPLGELTSVLPEGIKIETGDDGLLRVQRSDDYKKQRERHGLTRALLNNCITGVSQGWVKKLELVGVGFRAQLKGKELVLSLGFSHEVKYNLPEGVDAAVTDQVRIELKSIDKQKIGQVAAEIRSLKPPEPYKGKGIRYAGENIRRKAGKAGKAGKK